MSCHNCKHPHKHKVKKPVEPVTQPVVEGQKKEGLLARVKKYLNGK